MSKARTTPRNQPLWRTFLTPGWVIAAVLAVAFSWFAITWLSPWQLGKDHDIKERNERIEAAYEQDPVPLDAVVRDDGTVDPNDEWTRVTLTGHYQGSNEVLLRMRPVGGSPAFQSLVPFDTDAGQTVLVNRGWVPADNGGTAVPDLAAPPTQTVTVTALVRLTESPHSGGVVEEQGYRMVQSISTEQIGELTGTSLASPYMQLTADQPGVLSPIPLPQLDRGNHLSYGLQWIAFGIMAPAGLLYFVYSELRERRRYREEEQELSELVADGDENAGTGGSDNGGSGADADSDTHVPAPATTPASSPAPARARYGTNRRSNPWAGKAGEERF